MMISRSIVFLALMLATPLYAQQIEDLRGGWIADIDGTRHIFYLVLRNDSVTGFYCTECDNPGNLAFIDDGRLDDSGFSFSIYHYPADREAYRELVQAELRGKNLYLSRQRQGSDRGMEIEPTQMLLMRSPVLVDEAVVPPADPTTNATVAARVRIQPGPAQTVSAHNVVGLWLWGTGPGKQYFIFKQHGDQIRGMVCGPCDSVPDMAPLESIRMSGSNFHFEIVHEDNGLDFEIYGPHSNVTDAIIANNEMLLSVTPSFEPEPYTPIEMTLLGPITYQ